MRDNKLMRLIVTPGKPDSVARTVQYTVEDPQKPGACAVFEFQILLKAGAPAAAVLRSIKLERLIGAEPITVTAVRDWPLARWEAAARGAVTAEQSLGGPVEPEALLRSVFPEVEHAGDTPGERRHWNGLRKLAEAAVLYRELVTEGRADPSAEMARIKNVSPATSRSWIHRARQVGLLGPAVGRTAGEAHRGA